MVMAFTVGVPRQMLRREGETGIIRVLYGDSVHNKKVRSASLWKRAWMLRRNNRSQLRAIAAAAEALQLELTRDCGTNTVFDAALLLFRDSSSALSSVSR